MCSVLTMYDNVRQQREQEARQSELYEQIGRLQMELEELSRYSAGIQESLSILGVTSGYAPPKENTANEKEFDPSVG